MIKVIKYTGEHLFMFPNGALATKEAVLEQFPAALTFTHIVETDENEEVMWAFENLSAMRTKYAIDKSLSDDDAIAKIEEAINTPTETTSTVSDQTRIADALEDMVVLQEINSTTA